MLDGTREKVMRREAAAMDGLGLSSTAMAERFILAINEAERVAREHARLRKMRQDAHDEFDGMNSKIQDAELLLRKGCSHPATTNSWGCAESPRVTTCDLCGAEI